MGPRRHTIQKHETEMTRDMVKRLPTRSLVGGGEGGRAKVVNDCFTIVCPSPSTALAENLI
jgi:hypothetical protein